MMSGHISIRWLIIVGLTALVLAILGTCGCGSRRTSIVAPPNTVPQERTIAAWEETRSQAILAARQLCDAATDELAPAAPEDAPQSEVVSVALQYLALARALLGAVLKEEPPQFPLSIASRESLDALLRLIPERAGDARKAERQMSQLIADAFDPGTGLGRKVRFAFLGLLIVTAVVGYAVVRLRYGEVLGTVASLVGLAAVVLYALLFYWHYVVLGAAALAGLVLLGLAVYAVASGKFEQRVVSAVQSARAELAEIDPETLRRFDAAMREAMGSAWVESRVRGIKAAAEVESVT